MNPAAPVTRTRTPGRYPMRLAASGFLLGGHHSVVGSRRRAQMEEKLDVPLAPRDGRGGVRQDLVLEGAGGVANPGERVESGGRIADDPTLADARPTDL